MAHVPGRKATAGGAQAGDPVEGELGGDAEGRNQARRNRVAGAGQGKRRGALRRRRRCCDRDAADREEQRGACVAAGERTRPWRQRESPTPRLVEENR